MAGFKDRDAAQGQPAIGAHELSPPSSHSPCAICGKPQLLAYRPFCSKRCADVDLARWLSGTYAIPAAPEDEEGDGEV